MRLLVSYLPEEEHEHVDLIRALMELFPGDVATQDAKPRKGNKNEWVYVRTPEFSEYSKKAVTECRKGKVERT